MLILEIIMVSLAAIRANVLRSILTTLGIIIGERSHWGRGYGPEAMTALLDYGFRQLGLDRRVTPART